ncbi:Imm49 family immunity protein [Streptomyces sp. NPDC127068]|uniref:immunity 49 family protein n=1 Tax=Streptomyces sp. NPDC127068 TaxID=3347127 RepID=UPI003664D028
MRDEGVGRHGVTEAVLVAARADFAERAGKDVHMMRYDPLPALGWQMLAEMFLDYVAARSVQDPALSCLDARAAFQSAARAAVGALELTASGGAETRVVVDYVGIEGVYRDAEPDGGRGVVSAVDWVDAFCLSFVAGTLPETASAFIESSAVLRGRSEHADTALAHALLAYVYGYAADRDLAQGQTLTSGASNLALVERCVWRVAPGEDRPRQRAALSTLRALAAGDRDGFLRCLRSQLTVHRRIQESRSDGSRTARSLLPLDAIALAAMAHRWLQWSAPLSDYLPAALVTGLARAPLRVLAHGRDKRPDALAALAAGPLTVERPRSPRPALPRESVYDQSSGEAVAKFRDPTADPAGVAQGLTALREIQSVRFLSRAASDPDGADPRQHAALRIGAQAGAAALRLAHAAPDTWVEVTVDGTTRLLPALRDPGAVTVTAWRRTAALAMAVGLPDLLADCARTAPEQFAAGRGGANTAYALALHAYLSGTDPEHALDRALRNDGRRARAADGPGAPAVLLSQLVAGDRTGFVLALADALEEHRDHFTVGDRGTAVDAAVSLDVLGLACHAHRMGWDVVVHSPYLPRGLLRRSPD